MCGAVGVRISPGDEEAAGPEWVSFDLVWHRWAIMVAEPLWVAVHAKPLLAP